jgi:diguanylate cyclase (GGDEF)-like protein
MVEKKDKILIIEDDPQFCSLLSHYLSRKGYEVISVNPYGGVKETVEEVYQHNPDLILSDILMQPDGFKILKAIKSDSRLMMVPFVFISAAEQAPNKIRAYLDGAENYISKPVQQEELIAKISSILKRQKQVSSVINIDPLTKIHNRRFFNKEFQRQIKLHTRHKDEFTLAILDLDHFKRINDTYGHPCGDKCLVAFADFVKNEIRSTDIFARWGGEEFVLILERSELAGAARTVQKILDQLRAKPLVTWEGQPISISFSAGIAQFPHHGTTGKDLIEAADQAVYEAKRLGRGRVEIYKPKSK